MILYKLKSGWRKPAAFCVRLMVLLAVYYRQVGGWQGGIYKA